MVLRYVRILALAFLAIVALGGSSFAQRDRLHFTIDAPYRLRMDNYILPAGRYQIYQVSNNDLNTFFLYYGDRTHSPVAVLHTIGRGFNGRWPDKAKVYWKISESGMRSVPVVTGWDIPGYTGWEIVGVVTKSGGGERLGRVR